MIDLKALLEIIALYERHGWLLRRVLIREPENIVAWNPVDIKNVPLKQGEIDAAWFSRPPNSGPVAWELRYLGDKPYALLESLDEDDPDFEKSLSRVEARLGTAVGKK